MRVIFALALALGGAAAADDKGGQENPEGDYVLVGFDSKDLKLNREALKKMPFSKREIGIKGDRITMEFRGTKESKTIKLDKTKTPHEIDLTSTKGEKTQVEYGIYEFGNGILNLCANPKGEAKDRPKEFKAAGDAYSMTLRVRGELEGEYLLTGLEGKGFALLEEQFKKVPDIERTLVIDEDEILSTFNGKEERATIKLDKSKTPHQIDIVSVKSGKVEVNYGIYKFENGVLTICTTEKGEAKDRPKEFKVVAKELMLVLKKHEAK